MLKVCVTHYLNGRDTGVLYSYSIIDQEGDNVVATVQDNIEPKELWRTMLQHKVRFDHGMISLMK